jgi:hypothetical protein
VNGKERRETGQTYGWWNLSDDDNQEPDEALTIGHIPINQKTHGQRESTHLFPEEVGQTNFATTRTAQTKQAKQHDEKQYNVGNWYDDEVE